MCFQEMLTDYGSQIFFYEEVQLFFTVGGGLFLLFSVFRDGTSSMKQSSLCYHLCSPTELNNQTYLCFKGFLILTGPGTVKLNI